jgi:WD40 repeat protein
VRLRVVSDHDRPHQLGQPLTGHTGAINGVAFAPDGRTLATTSTDQTAILWDVPRFGRFRAVRCKKLASAPVDRSIRQRGPSTPPRSVTRTPALIVDQAGSAVRGGGRLRSVDCAGVRGRRRALPHTTALPGYRCPPP